jgi:hypothetical protein
MVPGARARTDRFGGALKLLGRYDWRGELAGCSYCPYRTAIPLSPIGGPFGGTATATAATSAATHRLGAFIVR